MAMSADLLFDEFAASYARGERPDARDYLERAGDARDELAHLLDGYLAAAPVQPPGGETLALFASLVPEAASEATQPPLLAERVRRGWRRDEIVDWIRERFGIAEEKREKVARYWHELETGLLPASRISERLREALSERFGDALEAALTWERPSIEARLRYQRAPGVLYEMQASVEEIALAAPVQSERDAVDELFVDQSDMSRRGDR